MIIGFGLVCMTMIIGATPGTLPYSQWGKSPWVRYHLIIAAAAGGGGWDEEGEEVGEEDGDEDIMC